MGGQVWEREAREGKWEGVDPMALSVGQRTVIESWKGQGNLGEVGVGEEWGCMDQEWPSHQSRRPNTLNRAPACWATPGLPGNAGLAPVGCVRRHSAP